jgi:P4 family phage/plasmid primase-like protien
MKRLTSKDRISARALYKDPVEFLPTHTTIMHTNHLPKLSSLDGGTKRRIAVAPFPATLPPEQVITNYESLLVRECSGVILRWIVDGAVKFYKAGCKLTKPKCVVQATERYIASQDWLAAYLEDRCEMRDGYTVGATELMIDYKAWAERQGEYVRKRNDLQSAMEARGFEKEKLRHNGVWIWRGLRFREEGM